MPSSSCAPRHPAPGTRTCRLGRKCTPLTECVTSVEASAQRSPAPATTAGGTSANRAVIPARSIGPHVPCVPHARQQRDPRRQAAAPIRRRRGAARARRRTGRGGAARRRRLRPDARARARHAALPRRHHRAARRAGDERGEQRRPRAVVADVRSRTAIQDLRRTEAERLDRAERDASISERVCALPAGCSRVGHSANRFAPERGVVRHDRRGRLQRRRPLAGDVREASARKSDVLIGWTHAAPRHDARPCPRSRTRASRARLDRPRGDRHRAAPSRGHRERRGRGSCERDACVS